MKETLIFVNPGKMGEPDGRKLVGDLQNKTLAERDTTAVARLWQEQAGLYADIHVAARTFLGKMVKQAGQSDHSKYPEKNRDVTSRDSSGPCQKGRNDSQQHKRSE